MGPGGNAPRNRDHSDEDEAPLMLKAVVHLVGGRTRTLTTETTGC
jgi:hypothetical protein